MVDLDENFVFGNIGQRKFFDMGGGDIVNLYGAYDCFTGHSLKTALSD